MMLSTSCSRPTLRKCRHLEEDRISMLPEEILVVIISHLTLVEATRTSVLSHRWRYLWTYTTGALDFVKSISMDDAYKQLTFEAARCKFIEWVNHVLNLLKSSTIDEFRLSFDLKKGNSDAINSWIKFSLQRQVKKLVLDFRDIDHRSRQYALTTQVFSHSSLGSVTALHLMDVDVTGEVIEYILSNSPLLQQLRLHLSLSLVQLKVPGPSPHLRRLEIKHCPAMRSLEVHATNLVSFAYFGNKICIYFKEFPCLIEAGFDRNLLKKNLCDYSSYFSRLELLVFDFTSAILTPAENHKAFPKLPSFPKLKQLEARFDGITVDYYVRWCTKLLKASPALLRFMLKIYDIPGHKSSGIIQRRKVNYQHKQLKVIEFDGFLGHEKDVEIVVRLLEKLPSLQKVVIDPHPFYPLRCGRELDCLQRTPIDLDKATANAQLVRNYLPPGAELVVLSHSNRPRLPAILRSNPHPDCLM